MGIDQEAEEKADKITIEIIDLFERNKILPRLAISILCSILVEILKKFYPIKFSMKVMETLTYRLTEKYEDTKNDS